MLKPPACQGCPAYGAGHGFVPDHLVPGARVGVMGQNPGEYEERGLRCVEPVAGGWRTEAASPQPFIGPTGYVLRHQMFLRLGLEESGISLMNAQRCRWGGSNRMVPLRAAEQREAITHCQRAHGPAVWPPVMVAEGEYALWALTGEGIGPGRSLSAWRGYALPLTPPWRSVERVRGHSGIWQPAPGETIVLPTYHTAYLFRAPWETPVARRDWARVAQAVEGHWPAPLPAIDRKPPVVWPSQAAFDTEFHADGSLIRYSAYWEGPTGDPHLHVVEREDTAPIPPSSTVFILQNAPADLPILSGLCGGQTPAYHDTMLAHAVLWGDLPHGLDFAGSLYGRLNRWKHLAASHPIAYSAADAVATWDWWQGMQSEFASDPPSWQAYAKRRLPLWDLILKAQARGVRVNRPRVRDLLAEFKQEQDQWTARAQATAGWPMSLSAPQQVGRMLADL